MARKLVVEARKLTFQQLCEDGITPEALLLEIMRGKEFVSINGRKKKVTAQMYDAACRLMPYRLPRLNSIDAHVKTVDLTQEEWVAQLDRDQQQGGR